MKFFFIYLFLLFIQFDIIAQEPAVKQTNLAFLLMTTDASGAGFGNAGAAMPSNAFAMQWNPAKYIFDRGNGGVGLTINPWKRNLATDMNLYYVAGFYKLSNTQAVAAAFRYFTEGANIFTDNQGNELLSYKPTDIALEGAYIRKLSPNISISSTLKYIRSDIRAVDFLQGAAERGNSIAADVAAFLQYELPGKQYDNVLRLSGSINNVGPKVKYQTVSGKLPTLARIGATYMLTLDTSSTATFGVQFDQLLGSTFNNGFSSSVGGELAFFRAFMIRSGFARLQTFPMQGNYLTTGLGVRHKDLTLNISCWFATQEQNVVNNSFQYSISYDF